MKTFAITPKNLFITLIIILFNLSLFAHNGVNFSIQIPKQTELEKLQTYSPIKMRSTSIEVGYFDDYIMAMKVKQDLKNNGIETPEIIAFFHNNPVSIADAFELQDNQNELDQKLGGPIMSETQATALLNQVADENFYYTVQIAITTVQQVEAFFAFPKTIDENITNKGHYRYTYGRFKTLQGAKDALRMVKEYGLADALIIAFDEQSRIPLSRAIEIEQQKLNAALAKN